MDSKDNTIPLSDRKVMRRGLIAAVGSLGAAAMLKLSGAAKAVPAEATRGPLQLAFSSDEGNVGNATLNSVTLAPTPKAIAPYPANFLFKFDTSDGVASAGNYIDALWVTAQGSSGYGLTATGGTGAGGGSRGVSAGGGTSTTVGSSGGIGVLGLGGLNTAGGSGGLGVQATGGSSLGSGNGGHGLTATGGNSSGLAGRGVEGFSTNNKGVFGQSSSSDGVHGTSTNGVGLRGTSPNFVGIVGISDFNIGLYGYNAQPNVPALYAENLASVGRIAARFNGDVQIVGSLTATSKNAVVTMADGNEALLYCQEAPEPYFEDFGRARLVNGQARVQLEAEYASLIKRDDYMVFLTPEGELKNPLYISQKNGNAFEVREANGGKSDLPFTYRIVGRRKDIDGKRLARVDPKAKQHIAAMKTQAASKQQRSIAGLGNQLIESPIIPHEPIVAETPPPPSSHRKS